MPPKGQRLSPEAIAKISVAKLGQPRSEESIRKQKLSWTPERREQFGASQRGKEVSNATRRKQGDLSRARWTDPEYHKMMVERQTGRTFTEDHIFKIAEANRAKAKDPIFCEKISLSKKDVPRSEVFRQSIRGENNPCWRGGTTPISKALRECANYYEWRDAVYKRDDYRDWFSGVKGNGNLNAHHVVPFNVLLARHKITSIEQAMKCDALWDINNGVTMLHTSHKAYHQMWRKRL